MRREQYFNNYPLPELFGIVNEDIVRFFEFPSATVINKLLNMITQHILLEDHHHL